MSKPKLQTIEALPVACFAPPISDEKLARYEQLGKQAAMTPEQRDAFAMLLKCVSAWWNLPESNRSDGRKFRLKHRGEEITVAETPLTDELVQQLWDVTPWMRELDTLSNGQESGLFDALPAGELRDAAMHLLWHCKEITLDREPLTQDRLPA